MRLIDRGKKGRGLRLAVSVSAVRRELIEMFAGAIIDLYNVCSECHEIANYFPLKKNNVSNDIAFLWYDRKWFTF